MPLNILHHKSWNVYSTQNIERVRRDEAEAAAAAEAEDTRKTTQDASHRLELLRARGAGGSEGHAPALDSAGSDSLPAPASPAEDDPANDRQHKRRRTAQDHFFNRVGLTDSEGHINLFPEKPRKAEGNAEYEAEKRAREESFAAQYTMALGKPADELKPWYSSLDGVGEKQKEREKNAKRTEWVRVKEARRKDWGDPLAAMKRGSQRTRQVEEDRKEWRKMREREVGTVEDYKYTRSADSKSYHESNTRDHARRSSRSTDPESRRHKHRRKARGSESPDRSRSPSRPRRKRSKDRHYHRSGHAHVASREDLALAKLREEKEKREATERAKAEKLMRSEQADKKPGWQAVDGGRYSKQFGAGDVRRH